VQSRRLCRAHYLRWKKYGDFELRQKSYPQGVPLTHAILLEVLHYDELSGLFIRKVSVRGQSVGTIAGGLNGDGYITVDVNGASYLAHRLAVFYMTGEWPISLVDHENFDRSDNRWKNIRHANFNQNNHRRIIAPNATGFRGVTFIKTSGRWRAKISVQKTTVHLGVFPTAEEAHRAYADAAKKYYGDFATTESKVA
jgi:hypothetical protein